MAMANVDVVTRAMHGDHDAFAALIGMATNRLYALACLILRDSDRAEDATQEGRLLDRVECSREFYKLLAASTGNKVIAMIMDSVTEIHMRFVYAKVSSSGVAMARLAEKRRQFLAALGERDVATATRLMRAHLESVQRMLEQDPGAMSLHVALAEVQPGMRR